MPVRTRTLPALAALLTALLLAAACGGDGGGSDSASDDSQPDSGTTDSSEVFDPTEFGAGDDPSGDPDDPDTSVTPDGPDDPDECVVDPEEGNTATVVRDYLECVDPALGDQVTSASYDPTGLYLSGAVDPDDAVEICELASEFLYTELDGPESTRVVEVREEADELGDDLGALLASRDGPDDECQPA